MDIVELYKDQRNSLEKSAGVDRKKFQEILGHLQKYSFWPSENAMGRTLWEHQDAATSLLAAYICSDRSVPSEDIRNEAALVKMATGAGKSAVIALISRCLPQIRRVLILTPRVALTDQILKYVRHKFWAAMELDVGSPKSLYSDETGSDAGAVVEKAYAVRLLPSTVVSINKNSPDVDRMVLAGTLQGLDMVRRESIKPKSTDESKNGKIEAAQEFLKLIGTFDLIIVDEGHYEPAISWSRAIREADLPTVLFSATPYRNDYKSFRVKGRFVFNQPIQDALHEDRPIIRHPLFEDLGTPKAGVAKTSNVQTGPAVRIGDDGSEDSTSDRQLSAKEKADAEAFSSDLAERTKLLEAPEGIINWKTIVRAERLPKLKLLQRLLQELTGEKALVIHHAVARNNASQRLFHTVKAAQDSQGSDEVRFWLHETKLLEGIDDPTFIAAAIYDNFGNARQLIQQIGRVLRSSDPSRRTKQDAFVFAPPRHMVDIRTSWDRYLKFEEYCAKNPRYVVTKEAALPDHFISALPDLQYIEGEFRQRFMLDGKLDADDIQLPASAAVFDFNGLDFNKAFIREELAEAILENDRFRPIEVQRLPDHAVAVAYYGWRTSPWLRHQFFPEWTFGVCIVTKVGDLVFAHDTSGIVFDSKKLNMTRVDQRDLVRAIPSSSAKRPVRVIRMSAASLDMSERAIRAQATRTASFEDTFTDLLDPGMFPTSAFGRVGREGRYLGFAQARVRDTKPLPLPLPDYLAWTEALAQDIVANPLPENPVFGRYARIVAPPEDDDALPKNVLIDLGDSFEDFRGNKDDQPLRNLMQDVDNPDLCKDVDDEGNFEVEIAGIKFPCEIKYKAKTHRYRIASEELDAFFLAQSDSGRRSAFTFCEVLNRTQSFRVIPAVGDVVYANGKFYSPHGFEVREDGTFPQLDNVTSVPVLADLATEKGEKIYPRNKTAWRQESQFGLIKSICELPAGDPLPANYGALGEELSKFDLVVCDDDGQEIGDFLAIDTNRRLVCVIHAKASKNIHSSAVSALQVVGRQALASLAFCSGIAVAPKVAGKRWTTEVNANGKKLKGLKRVFKNANGLDDETVRKSVLDALRNKSWSKEVWIVAARLLDRGVLQTRLENGSNNQTMQMSMYLASLTTSCARANARLRIFCHERPEVDGVPEAVAELGIFDESDE